jgi:hypothetical protein
MSELLLKSNNWFCSAPGLKYPPGLTPSMIPNFSKVTDTLWRGGQPTQKGFKWLNRNFKYVMSLRDECQDQCREFVYGNLIGERWCIKNFDAPTETQAYAVVRCIDIADGPSFIHCADGLGRTGTMVACYRMHYGWSLNEAVNEANKFQILGLFKPLTKVQLNFLKYYYDTVKKA